MLKVSFAIPHHLVKKFRALTARKKALIAKVERDQASEKDIEELANIELTLSAFGESVIRLACVLEEKQRGCSIKSPRTIH